MSASAFSDQARGRSDENRAKIYYCAALTAPSTMTGHMQTGDILVSINDVSLISDSTQSESKESSEAFFDIITDAIKNAGSPKTVRLLRPSRAKAAHSSPTPSVFEIHLNASEASFLFDRSFTTHIPKFTVGKVAFGKSFEFAGGGLFDVVFPTQTSLGVRIFPYKLIDAHSTSTNHQTHRAPSLEADYLDSEEEILDDVDVIDDCSSVSSTAMRLFEEETRGTANKSSSESAAMANITDFLCRLETERSNSRSPTKLYQAQQHTSERIRRWSVDCGASSKQGKSNAHSAGQSANILGDDDIVTDAGIMSVGAHGSLFEVGDDFIPVSSSVESGHIAENFFQEAAREELAARKGRISKFAVEDMVAIIESNRRKHTPLRSSSVAARGSPLKKAKAVAGLDDFSAGTPKTLKPSRRSLPARITPSKSAIRVPSYLSPSTPSPTRRGRSPPRGYNIDDLAIHGDESATVETTQQELKRVMKENENLRAKMGFMQCSLSIEKQLLQYELKGAKARLLLAEKELEESTIEHKMNAISLQDDLDQSIKDIVSVMLQEKEDMAHKLHLARQDMTDMEVRYNDKIEAITEESENIQSELEGRKEDCIMLTADILNLQAERDCMKSSTVMTDFRTKNTNKTQSKELTRLRDAEKNTKSKMFDFIRDYDRTIATSADPNEVVSEFLSGRGIAINQNRRKHFAALKADNARLYDGFDTMQELLEVETALQVARVELYTKSLVNKPVEKKATPSPIKNKFKVLLNSESPAKTIRLASITSRVRGEGKSSISPRKSNTATDASVISSPEAASSNSSRVLRSKEKKSEKGSRKSLSSKTVRRVSSDELHNCKENHQSSESEGSRSGSNCEKSEFEKENTIVKSTENKVCENNSEFASNSMKSFSSPTMPLKKSISTSPSFIIITPRKKTPTTSPTSLLNSGSGFKVSPGLEASGNKFGGTFIGSKRPDLSQSPMVTISDDHPHSYPSVE